MVFLQLPGDLQYKERDNIDPMDDLLEVEDLYATVLYNDEVINDQLFIKWFDHCIDLSM